ncbi:hypothetical protein LOTGIDRAFT_160009 [Lottia gigantea]|uniref:Uncharacterized protein n=1 Tax=Lottia gigantea TaxID=225164 RepID=V4AGL5_LOTGI|nr:hypothetical protein LOTGIDRAFT_160009 [Lottia gigantea]ESO96027.1 hypothetical protein LOTGIDRAFT_160009 [Lottia gigantea]
MFFYDAYEYKKVVHTGLKENVRIVDPMDTDTLNIVANGQGTLKQQIHINGHNIIYNTVFASLGFGGISESAEHLEIDVLNQSDSNSYRVHLMFYSSNGMNILRLGFKYQGLSETAEQVNNIQLKGLIAERNDSTYSLCLEVKGGQIIHGSVFECYQGCLKGYAPTFTGNAIKRTVDSIGLRNGNIYFKFMPTMTRDGSRVYATNPAIIGNHQINIRSTASRIFWTIRNHSLSYSVNQTITNYRVYLDSNWHLAYSNNQFGNSTYGFLAYLRDLVLSGKRVRVAVQDRIYSVQMTSIFDKTIMVHLTDMYDGNAWSQKKPIHMRQLVSTSGDYHYCSFESESDVKINGASGMKPVAWYIENRCWRKIIRFDSEKNIVSGSTQELFDVASTGKSLRFILEYESCSDIYDVIQVHLFNTSFVVMNSVFGNVKSGVLECSKWSYTLYSTGTVEFSRWKPGRIMSFNRLLEKSHHYVQILSEM